jgi:hypothetical protein
MLIVCAIPFLGGCRSAPKQARANFGPTPPQEGMAPLSLAGTVWEIGGSRFSMMSGGPYAIGTLTFHADNTVTLVRAFPDRPFGFGVSEFIRDGKGKWTQSESGIRFQIVGDGFPGWDFEGGAQGWRMFGNARSTMGGSCQWQATFRGGRDARPVPPPATMPPPSSSQPAELAPLPREEYINPSSISAAGYYGLEAGEADSKNGKSKDASRHAAWVKNKFGPSQAYMDAFTRDYGKSYDARERYKLRQPTW